MEPLISVMAVLSIFTPIFPVNSSCPSVSNFIPPVPALIEMAPRPGHSMVSVPDGDLLAGGAGLQEILMVPATWSIASERLSSLVPNTIADLIGGEPGGPG